MKRKLFYEAPDAELIELHLENNQMQDTSTGSADLGGEEDLGDIG